MISCKSLWYRFTAGLEFYVVERAEMLSFIRSLRSALEAVCPDLLLVKNGKLCFDIWMPWICFVVVIRRSWIKSNACTGLTPTVVLTSFRGSFYESALQVKKTAVYRPITHVRNPLHGFLIVPLDCTLQLHEVFIQFWLALSKEIHLKMNIR